MPARPAARASLSKPAPVVAPSWLRLAVLICAGLLILGYCSPQASDTDTWWHLRTGQYILQQHRLPVPDPFSFTTNYGPASYPGELRTRYFNLTHEWLAQAMLYLAYAAGGFPALIVLRAVLMAAFCGAVGLVVWHRTRGFYRAVGASLGALSIAYTFAVDRPFIFTYFFLAATIVILEYRRPLWLLPPLFLLWANCHGGFLLGWAAVAVYCGEALYQRLRGSPPADEPRLWLCSGAAILVSGANPNGFGIIPTILAYRQSPMQSRITEWHPPVLTEISPFTLLLVIAPLVLLWARRRTRPADWLLLAIFGAASLMARRNLMLMAMAGPLLVATYLPASKRSVPVIAEFLAAVSILGGAGVGVAEGKAFQLNYAAWKFPVAAADFLLQHRISGRMFNSYANGGYLMWRLWPQERDFIDGRALNESVYQDYVRIMLNFGDRSGKSADQLLDEYGIDLIVTEGFGYYNGATHLLVAALSDPSQKKWKLVYRDDEAVIFVRNPPPDVPVLNSLEALASMEAQCSLRIENDPEESKCANAMAQLFARIGDRDRARKWAIFARGR
jgi:hypothetical protein